MTNRKINQCLDWLPVRVTYTIHAATSHNVWQKKTNPKAKQKLIDRRSLNGKVLQCLSKSVPLLMRVSPYHRTREGSDK